MLVLKKKLETFKLGFKRFVQDYNRESSICTLFSALDTGAH
jgi:hypothetical protein